MSFRHTAITEYLYKNGMVEELDKLQMLLDELGHFEWRGSGQEGLGYYHGVIKDLDGYETKNREQEIVDRIFKETSVRVKIVIE